LHSQPLSGQSAAFVHCLVQKPRSTPSLPLKRRHLPSAHSSALVQSSPSFLLPPPPELPELPELEEEEEEDDDDDELVLLQSSARSPRLWNSGSPDELDAPLEEPPLEEPPLEEPPLEEPPLEEPPLEEPDAPLEEPDAPLEEPPLEEDELVGQPLPPDDELEELEPQATAKATKAAAATYENLIGCVSLKKWSA